MRTYLLTDLRRAIRNRKLLLFTAAYPAVLYLLFSSIFDDGSTTDGLGTAPYLMVSMSIFGATGAALSVSGSISAEREAGWTRQLRLTPLSGATYVIGKVIVAYVGATFSVVIVFLLALATGAGDNGLARVSFGAALIVVGVAPFAAIGVFFGYLATGQASRPVMMFTWMGLAVFGGIWFPVEAMPSTMRSIAEVTPTYQLADAARGALVGHAPTLAAGVVLAAWTLAAVALAAWRYRDDAVSSNVALAS